MENLNMLKETAAEQYKILFNKEMKDTSTGEKSRNLLRCKIPLDDMPPAMATTKSYLIMLLECLDFDPVSRLKKKGKLARNICRLDKALNTGLITKKYHFNIEDHCNEVIRIYEEFFLSDLIDLDED